MSKISFEVGDYQKQIDKGITQEGLLYFNPDNRNITIGNIDAFINFNNLMINDNQQLTENYTNTSKYLVDNYITIDNNSKEYYSVNKANNIIGITDSTMDNGYIQQNIQTLINGIPYEGEFDYTYSYTSGHSQSLGYYYKTTTKQYTIYYPSDIINKQFSMLLLFVYQDDNNSLTPIIANTDGLHDTTVDFVATNTGLSPSVTYPNVPSTIYKAFWI